MKYTLLIFSIFFISCGTRNVYVWVEKPARIDLSDYNKILIGDFRDNYRNYDYFIKSEVSEILQRSQKFELFAGLPIDIRTGDPAEELLILEGDILRKTADHEIEFIEIELDKDSTEHKKYRIEIITSLIVNFRLLDFRSGKILYSQKLEDNDRWRDTYLDHFNPNIRKMSMLERSGADLAERFSRMILPRRIKQAAPFQFEGTKFDSAIKLAEVGEWESAIEKFFEIAKNSNNQETYAMAIFNMGLCYMYSYDFDKAREKFKEAFDHHDRSLYIDEIRVANRMEAEFEELKKRRRKRFE